MTAFKEKTTLLQVSSLLLRRRRQQHREGRINTVYGTQTPIWEHATDNNRQATKSYGRLWSIGGNACDPRGEQTNTLGYRTRRQRLGTKSRTDRTWSRQIDMLLLCLLSLLWQLPLHLRCFFGKISSSHNCQPVLYPWNVQCVSLGRLCSLYWSWHGELLQRRNVTRHN